MTWGAASIYLGTSGPSRVWIYAHFRRSGQVSGHMHMHMHMLHMHMYMCMYMYMYMCMYRTGFILRSSG